MTETQNESKLQEKNVALKLTMENIGILEKSWD